MPFPPLQQKLLGGGTPHPVKRGSLTFPSPPRNRNNL